MSSPKQKFNITNTLIQNEKKHCSKSIFFESVEALIFIYMFDYTLRRQLERAKGVNGLQKKFERAMCNL